MNIYINKVLITRKIFILILLTFFAIGTLWAESPSSEKIITAIEKGKTGTVKKYLQDGLSPNIDLGGGATPLMFATLYYQQKIMTLLLENGANPNTQTKNDGITALHLVHSDKGFKSAQILLNAGADPNIADTKGYSALLYAAISASPGLVKLLLEAGVDPNTVDKRGNTALILTINFFFSPNVEKVTKLLINNKADLNLANKRGITPLMSSTKRGNHYLTKILLKAGADVNAVDINGYTALMHSNSDQCNKMLLFSGADSNICNKWGRTALFCATAKETSATVKLLLKFNGDYSIKDKQGLDLLSYATKMDNLNIIKILLKKGMSPNISDKQGRSPLVIATINNNLELIQNLIKAGAQINAADKNGSTPLMIATKNNSLDIVRELLYAGADPNLADKTGSTALHIFFKQKDFTKGPNQNVNSQVRFDILNSLLNKGADTYKKDLMGKTPYDLAPKSTQKHMKSKEQKK